jgi:hypothetical protein
LVEFTEPWPLCISKNKAKSWEIKTSMITNFLVVTALGCLDIKINDSAINVLELSKSCNKRTDVLESSSPYQFGVSISQEVVINFR